MNPDLDFFNVCVVYTINGEMAEECFMVAAIEKEAVVAAIKWFYRESTIERLNSTIIAIIFN